ncbi:MAG: thioredoxin family protein [Bacteroidaceae bacterium]|nr:thioredoxin family protein [Bacteroidaceae bacterium]
MKRVSVFILLMLAFCATYAQMMEPVKVEASLEKVAEDKVELVFLMKIDEGWHVYGTEKLENGPTATSVSIERLQGAELVGALKYIGEPVRKFDEVFEMDVEYFEKGVEFRQEVKLTEEDYCIEGYLEYSACNNQSCMPPMKSEFSYGEAENSLVGGTDEYSFARGTDEHSFVGGTDEHNGLFLLFLFGLLGGLIALTTPCVWPIIPMTVSFFIKRGGGVRDALTYGLSIIIIYVGLGLIVTGLFGANALNSLATNAVFNVFFFAMLMVFGLSLVGLFEITLPASWTTSVDDKASKTTGFVAIFLMAFTLALVSFSCTGPIIGFLLVELATDGGSVFAPAVGMLGFSIGLALPFSVFAMFPGWLKQMPKSGSWMETVKKVLGVVEIAFSLKFFSVADLAYGWGLLSRRLFFVLWILLFAALGIYLVVQMVKNRKGSPLFYIMHTIVAAASLSLAAYMIPGLWGAPCTLVSAFAPPMEKSAEEKEKIFTDYDEALAFAKKEGRPLMVDFSGYGCVNCRKMEAAVFTDSVVADIIYNRYVFVQLFVDDRTPLAETEEVEENGKMRKLRTLGDKWSHLQATRYGANSQPFYVLIDSDGKLLAEPYSYNEDVEQFLKWVKGPLNF